MALTTEDVTIQELAGWTALILTGTVIHLSEVRGNTILYRFGIGSTSSGAIMDEGETLSVDETIYVKPNTNKTVTLTVTKD